MDPTEMVSLIQLGFLRLAGGLKRFDLPDLHLVKGTAVGCLIVAWPAREETLQIDFQCGGQKAGFASVFPFPLYLCR